MVLGSGFDQRQDHVPRTMDDQAYPNFRITAFTVPWMTGS